jgi:integrase
LVLKISYLNANVLTISVPKKNSNPKQFKISDRLIALVNALPKRDKRIFGPATNLNNFRGNFTKRRRYLARTLGNPQIDQITFHTFRHFGATMLYHKTGDILYVKQQLGHKRIENTMVYVQLITFESDEYNTAYAKSVEEEDKLIKAGFELVRYDNREQVATYCKRK